MRRFARRIGKGSAIIVGQGSLGNKPQMAFGLDSGREVAGDKLKPVVAGFGGAGRIPGDDAGIMYNKKVAETLFAQFGFTEFQTYQIPPDVMQRLTDLMEISDSDTEQSRKIKVGTHISKMEGFQYALESRRKVTMTVIRPENRHQRRRFRWA